MSDPIEPAELARDVSLESLNTLAIPARAAHFANLDNIEQLPQLLAFARHQHLSVFVLGEGSNCVFAGHYAGLVIRNQLRGIEVLHEDHQHARLRVAAGENWHAFVQWCLQRDLYGLENLALIPGTVGAAPIQNIGAYGVEVESFIECVHGVDSATAKPQQFTREECQFAYRESIFKGALRDQVLLTAVDFVLSKQFTAITHYPALAAALIAPITAQSVFDAVCAIRRAKLPDPRLTPNAGSFFKNPVVSAQQWSRLQADFPDIVSFTVPGGYKLAAAWLIEQAGWKQRDLDSVVVHAEQALVITNPQHRAGTTVLGYAEQIVRDIQQRFGVALEIEPRVIV